MTDEPGKSKREDDLITILEAVNTFSITEEALRAAIRRGRIPYQEFYGKKLLKPADVEAYKATAKKGRPKPGTASDENNAPLN